MCRVEIPERGMMEAIDKRLKIMTEIYMGMRSTLTEIEDRTLRLPGGMPEDFIKGYCTAMDEIRAAIRGSDR